MVVVCVFRYLLPIVHELLSRPQRLTRGEGTQALVLAPTRELCSQISDVLQRLLQPFYWLVPGSVTGGGEGFSLLLLHLLSPARKLQ